MISGKFLTDHLRDNEFDLETVSKTQWPGFSERKKLVFALKYFSALFSTLCLTVPNHGYLRYVSENIFVNELQKNTAQNQRIS